APLRCPGWGAGLTAAPVSRRIGGHAYGGTYSGPIGSVLTPLYDSVADNPHLPHASSLCGACQTACPVRIDIPRMLVGLRESQHQPRPDGERSRPAAKRTFDGERLADWLWKQALQRPGLWRRAPQAGRSPAVAVARRR